MKNYEVKYATKEFAGGKVKISNKRLAYLVPNMFGKLKSGFFKKVSSIVAVYQEEMQNNNPVVSETPIQEPIVENKEVVAAVVNEQPKPEVSSPEVSAPINDNKNPIKILNTNPPVALITSPGMINITTWKIL